MRKMSVCTDLTNEDSNCIKQKIRILDHPKKLKDVLRERLGTYQGLTGNSITTGTNHYRFNRTFLDGEALRIFDFKLAKVVHVRTSHLTRKRRIRTHNRLERKSRIRTHKPLNAQKLYNLRKAVYVRTSRLTRKSRTTFAKPFTLLKAVHKRAQKL